MKPLFDILTTLRALYFLTHHAHHVIAGPTFFSDHSTLGTFYNGLLEDFDALAEECMRQDAAATVKHRAQVDVEAAEAAGVVEGTRDAKVFFTTQTKLEGHLRDQIGTALKTINGPVSPSSRVTPRLDDGLQNLLQDLATKSSARSYQLQGRLG